MKPNTQKVKDVLKTTFDEWGRKKFTLDGEVQLQVEQKQQDRFDQEGRNKGLLIGRQQSLNIQKYIGRIQKNRKTKKREVFFCDVCNEGFKCDLAYITHLNSSQHNSKLGMSMNVKAVTPQAVKQKLQQIKNSNQSKKSYNQTAYLKEEEIKLKDSRKKQQDNKRNEYKQQQGACKQQFDEKNEQQEEQEEDSLQAELKLYGLPTSFGSKKQKRC